MIFKDFLKLHFTTKLVTYTVHNFICSWKRRSVKKSRTLFYAWSDSDSSEVYVRVRRASLSL